VGDGLRRKRRREVRTPARAGSPLSHEIRFFSTRLKALKLTGSLRAACSSPHICWIRARHWEPLSGEGIVHDVCVARPSDNYGSEAAGLGLWTSSERPALI
jgi:hypothetical protein